MSEDVVGLIFILFSVAFLPAVGIFVTGQAAEGRMDRNASSGIRTRHTRASDEAWIAGHRAALPVVKGMWPVAALGTLLAVGAQILAGGPSGIVLALVTLLAETAVLVRAASIANRAARAGDGT